MNVVCEKELNSDEIKRAISNLKDDLDLDFLFDVFWAFEPFENLGFNKFKLTLETMKEE